MENNLNIRLYLLKENNKYHHHANTGVIIRMDLIQVELLEGKEVDSICFQELKNQIYHNQLQTAMILSNLCKLKRLNH